MPCRGAFTHLVCGFILSCADVYNLDQQNVWPLLAVVLPLHLPRFLLELLPAEV